MRSLVKILCFTLLISYLQAEPDNPRLPKLGPTIVEKPFKLDEDLALIIDGIDEDVRTIGNVTDLVTLNGMDKKHVTRANVTDLLTSRTYKQRMELSKAYEQRANWSLSMAVNKINRTWSNDPFDALFTGMEGLLRGFVEDSLDKVRDWAYMSILCTSSATQLTMLNNLQYTYRENSLDPTSWKQKTLNELIHLKMDSHAGKKVLSTIINANPLRPESGVDQSKFKKQLKAIPKLDTDCWTSNNHLLDLMAKESFEHIKAVDDEYRNKHDGKTVLEKIDKHCSGEVKQAYRRIVMYAVDPFGYFADEIHAALTDSNCGEEPLYIVGYTRCEIDLKDIEAAYHIRYQKTVLEAMATWSSPSDVTNYILYGVYRGNTGNCP